MKILCVCPIGVGNYLLCYPAFSLLKKSSSGLSMYLLALRIGIAELAEGDTLWSGVYVFDPTKIRTNIMAAFRTVFKLRAQRFDASLNFFPSNTWQYHLLPWVAGIKKRFAFKYHVSGPMKLSFLGNHVTPVDIELHDVQQNLALAVSYLSGSAGISKEPETLPIVFPCLFSDDDAKWAKSHLSSLSQNEIRIGIHPGSSREHGMDAKRWPPGNFAGLADRICQMINGEAFVFGGADEDSLKTGVVDSMTSRAHVVPSVSLQKTAALLSRCALCICNDSGLMHMAACQGVPTIGIFGPTDEKRNGPYGAKTLVVRKKMQGFPLWTARNVGDRSHSAGLDPQASLKALSVEDAWEQIRPWMIRTFGLGFFTKAE